MAFFMRPPWCSHGDEQPDGSYKEYNHECTNYEGNDVDILYPTAGLYHLNNELYICIELGLIFIMLTDFIFEL